MMKQRWPEFKHLTLVYLSKYLYEIHKSIYHLCRDLLTKKILYPMNSKWKFYKVKKVFFTLMSIGFWEVAKIKS